MVDLHGSFYGATGKVYLQTASGATEVGDVTDLEALATAADASADAAAASAAAALVSETNAESARDAALAGANFRSTIAEGIADFAVGEYFTSTDDGALTANTGVIRMYKRIVGSPFYQDEGDDAAPVSASKVNQVAYIDFTAKADGLPPSALDTGQAVDYTFDTTGRRTQIASGRLEIYDRAAAGSGGLADYYQSDLGGGAVRRVGMEWTQPAGSDDGYGATALIAFASIYTGTGNVPKSWCHIVFVPGTSATGSAKWFVCDGAGHLLNVKTQTFTNPAADGVTRWRSDAVLDFSAGMAYARLPDGSVMTLSNAEIAAFCTAAAVTPFTFSDIGSCPVICCEHFCASHADTATFGGFTALWGETEDTIAKPWSFKGSTPIDILKAEKRLFDNTPPVAKGTLYAPTTALSAATTTSTTNVDATNAVITCTAGPSGIIIYEVAAYYEWTGTDRVFWRLILNNSAPATSLRVADLGVSGEKKVSRMTIPVSGLTPGLSYTATLQHSAVSGALATLKAGGSGGSMVPPLTITALPA